MVLFGSRIGQHDSPLTFEVAKQAMHPDYYPAEGRPLELSLENLQLEDTSKEYWEIHDLNLINSFRRFVEQYKLSGPIKHFSVFAIAPQPLLIRLGSLFSNLHNIKVYELHKEPATWAWLDDDSTKEFKFVRGKIVSNKIALKVEVSSKIANSRIHKVLGNDCTIHVITQSSPKLDSIKSEKHLSEFRISVREAFAEIKQIHGEDAVINVFPSMSPAPSVEFGRVWLPKADLPIVIYEQNSKKDGFFKALSIENNIHNKKL